MFSPPQITFRTLASSLPIAVCLTGAWLSPVAAEGSKDMYPAGALGNRGHIEWQDTTVAGFERRTLLRVFANAGENILVGSSAVGVGAGDIEIFNPGTVVGNVANETLPGTAAFACVADRANTNEGFIATRAEELAGPDSADGTGNVAGYEPCIYVAPTTGIYFVAMYGPSGSSSTASANNGVQPSIESVNTAANQNTGISAWDVTVRSSDTSSTTDLEGRLHTFFISKNMGSNGRTLHSNLYPVTVDGYRYEVDMRGLDPFAFSIFGNQLGNLDSDGASPLYGDVVGANGAIANPLGNTSSAPPQYPMFFNPLDPAALPFMTVYHPTTGALVGSGFPTSAILPVTNTPAFSGDISGNTSNISSGGTFSFNSNITGVYEIVLSRDGVNFDPSNLNNRVLRGVMLTAGAQTVSWNGLDNSGIAFPTGNYGFRVVIHGGEYHFPISDAENNFSGGPIYTLLNATNPLGNTTAFYDHRGYRTIGGFDVEDRDTGDGDPFDDALCGQGPPSPPNTDLITGADSTDPSFNAFGLSSGGNANVRCAPGGAFGDTKTVDLWTYLPSTPSAADVIIIDASAVDYGDAPDTSATNGVGNYSTLRANDGPIHSTSADIFLGSAVTDDTDGFGNGTDANGNATDDVDDAFVSLPDATTGTTYDLTGILVNNSTGESATLHAWIDFDQDGQFEADEYTSASVASGDTTADVSWLVPSGAASTTYARFRLTTDDLNDTIATTDVDERSVGGADDGEVEDYVLLVVIPLATDPNILLLKRITAINRGLADEQLFDATYINFGTTSDDDNVLNWPGNPVAENFGGGTDTVEEYIAGITGVNNMTAVAGVTVNPGDVIEYTISFLSDGETVAQDLLICDRIPTRTTFDASAFNASPPATASPGDRGILLSFNGGPDVALTNANDGDEIAETGGNDNGVGGYYFPPLIEPSTVLGTTVKCLGPNNNGAVVVDLSDVPNATGDGVPLDSHGFIRFRVVVD